MEYRLPGVSQIDVKSEIGLTFANGLRAILRQDPNIVMVGEIRDFETAEIAIRAAMTGHLVFSTLHTNDAVSGITRLLDMGIEPFLLASVVRCFLAQRLVRTICADCREEATYDADYLREIELHVPPGHEALPRRRLRHLPADRLPRTFRDLRGLHRHRGAAPHDHPQGNRQRAESPGHRRTAWKRLRTDGWRRVLRGQTTVEEIVRVTQADEAITETR